MNLPDEYALALLARGRDDLYVVRRLAVDPDAPGWVLGFHAQQAVEKALKAVLSGCGMAYPRTHNLVMLAELAPPRSSLRRAGVDASARAGVLTVGTIVAIAATKAGDISQDLKTGWLVGATPARQQLGQLIGAAFACWAVAATVMLLGTAYEFGSREIPAPQATLMKTIIEGVLAGALPWDLVLTGAGLSIGAMLCGVSGLAFAIGVYLPLGTMAPLYVGGCMRAMAERNRVSRREGASDPGILAASGLVAGVVVEHSTIVRAVPGVFP